MSDLISRQAAIDAIEEYAYRLQIVYWKENPGVPYKAYALNWCINTIRDLPSAQPDPHWIPCSERLPEKDGDYIVTFEKGYASDYGLDPIGIAPFEVDCEGFGFWQENFDMHTLGSLGTDWVDINVIAWMPIPEAYREDGEAE